MTMGCNNCWPERLRVFPYLAASIHLLQRFISVAALSSWTFNLSRRHFEASGQITPLSKVITKANLFCTIPKNGQHGHPLLSLCAKGSKEIHTDVYFDDFFEDSFDEYVSASNSSKKCECDAEKNVTSHFIEGRAAIGIGGNDGFVYDVNSLKRNLVQESVRECKQELLILLRDGKQHQSINVNSKTTVDRKQQVVVPQRWKRERNELIEERLAALVQANPVSTTTDSNLLDGEWSFAFATNSALTILGTSRFLLSKPKRIYLPENNLSEKPKNKGNTVTVRGGPWRFRSGKTENPFRSSTREINLENLGGNENAHIIDETRVLGGLLQISRRYDVFGLTRTALDLDLVESESRLFGFRLNSNSRDEFKGTKHALPLEIQILYLDTDLCICTTGAGLDGPLHVYTKSDSWVTGGVGRKLVEKAASRILTMQSPLRFRQRMMDVFATRSWQVPTKPGPGLKVVNIGELDMNDDGTTKEDPAWDGPDDPFMHLSQGERMEVLKTMSLQDIYQSATERKEQNKKPKKKWVGNRDKKFRRPDL